MQTRYNRLQMLVLSLKNVFHPKLCQLKKYISRIYSSKDVAFSDTVIIPFVMISKINIWGHGELNATSPTETDLAYRDPPLKNKCIH